MLHASCFLDSFFDSEGGGSIFCRNIGGFLPSYTALRRRILRHSTSKFWGLQLKRDCIFFCDVRTECFNVAQMNFTPRRGDKAWRMLGIFTHSAYPRQDTNELVQFEYERSRTGYTTGRTLGIFCCSKCHVQFTETFRSKALNSLPAQTLWRGFESPSMHECRP
jgi:hypothetical protein